MGYAMMNQRTHGIHFRLRARAYIFDDGVKRVRVCVRTVVGLCVGERCLDAGGWTNRFPASFVALVH